ncbi:glycosyltransferase family 4 protein [Microbacterium wangchenii]
MSVVTSSVRGRVGTRLRTIFQAYREVRRARHRCLHFHLSHRGSFIREGFLILRAPRTNGLFATIHGSDFVRTTRESWLWRLIYRTVLGRLSGVAVLNEDARSAVTGLVAGTSVSILPNPGPIDAQPEDLSFTGDRKVLFAGRVGHRKGVDTLIRAWDSVRERYPDASLLLFGPLDADLDPDIEARLPEFHRGEQSPSATHAALRDSACAVLPSRAEGQPMFLIEALAFGVPLVVSDVGGMPGLAMGCGLVVERDNPGALADALCEVLAGGEPVREMRKRARDKYAGSFSIAAHDERLRQFYGLAPSRSIVQER